MVLYFLLTWTEPARVPLVYVCNICCTKREYPAWDKCKLMKVVSWKRKLMGKGRVLYRGSPAVPDEPMEMLSPIIMTFGPVVDMLLGPWHPTTLERRMMESIFL